MSDEIEIGFQTERAVRYNRRTAKRYGLPLAIPRLARLAYPRLALDPRCAGPRFAVAVVRVQQFLFKHTDDHDGMYGPRTHEAVQARWSGVERHEAHILHDGVRRLMRIDAPLYGVDHPQGLGITRDGHHRWGRQRPREISLIVLHWGGRDPGHLARFYRATEHKRSAHFSVGMVGVEERVYQLLDLGRVAYHVGGPSNEISIGIDVSQWAHREPERYGVEAIPNPEMAAAGGRGFPRINALHPSTAAAVRELVFALLRALALDPACPRDDIGDVDHGVIDMGRITRERITVVGHHHLSARKSDIIGWWGQIFDGTELGEQEVSDD